MKNLFRLFFVIQIFICGQIQSQNKIAYTIEAGPGVKKGIYSPGSEYFITSNEKKIKVWLASTGALVKEMSTNFIVNDLAFTTDGKEIIAAAGNDLIVFNQESGKSTGIMKGHSAKINAIEFTSDGKFIVSASEDHTVKVWNLEHKINTQTFTEHSKPVNAIDLSSDGKFLASAGSDSQILLRQLASGIVINKMSKGNEVIYALAFSPDGSKLASGGTDQEVVIWDPLKGSIIKSVKYHTGWIHDLEYSPDGKYLMLASGDKRVRILEENSEVFFLTYPKNNFPPVSVAFSPDGKHLSIVNYGNSKVEVRDVRALNITPRIFFKNADDKNPPQVMVTYPTGFKDSKVTVYEDNLNLKGNAIDETGVHTVFVNGMEVKISSGGDFNINLKLATGDNFVKIEATDLQNNTSIKKINIFKANADENLVYDAKDAKTYLLVIGIDKYKYWRPLENAVKDATDIVGLLTAKYKFENANTVSLYNEKATIQNIYGEMRSLVEKITPNDNLLIYYSGHGFYDPLLKEGYWIPVDAHKAADGEYLSNTSIMNLLGKINTRHTLLIADACFSGALFQDAHRGYVENVEKTKSRWGLTSGRLENVSDGRVGGNSPFAEHLIKFLKDNDKNKFPISELVQEVKVNVANSSDQTPIGNPLRNIGDEGGEFIFYKK